MAIKRSNIKLNVDANGDYEGYAYTLVGIDVKDGLVDSVIYKLADDVFKVSGYDADADPEDVTPEG
jgi:hypothetical protein